MSIVIEICVPTGGPTFPVYSVAPIMQSSKHVRGLASYVRTATAQPVLGVTAPYAILSPIFRSTVIVATRATVLLGVHTY